MSKVTAIILAGGIGSRMNSDITKQNIVLLGKTIFERTLEAFCASSLVSDVVVVARREEVDFLKEKAESVSSKKIAVVVGGKTRAQSARNGFLHACDYTDYVAIHDCARCLVTPKMIDSVISAAFECGAATATCSVTDTVKMVSDDGTIASTIPRDKVYRAQTPQVFDTKLYKSALDEAGEQLDSYTDDNMLVENIGAKIKCVDLGMTNMKITTFDDISLAEFILKQRGDQ